MLNENTDVQTDSSEDSEDSRELVLYVFANQHPATELEQILYTFYHGASVNRLGIMQAFNSALNKEELLLVGVELLENGDTVKYPLCRLLTAEEVVNYHAPDHKGGWEGIADPSPEEAE